MTDRVEQVDVFTLTLPRETPYLGALRPGEKANARGYFVRQGNQTVYPIFDRSVLVRITTSQGVIGWGETYGIVAPGAVCEIITDLITDFVIGRDPLDASVIHDQLYDLTRVRGYTGGFYLDALAAVDIALWDITGQIAGLPLVKLLGGQRRENIPAYVSGLPEATRSSRVEFAAAWLAKGFDAFKFSSAVADDGVALEMQALRERLGTTPRIACDMHWAHTSAEAVALIQQMAPFGLWFAEAPVRTEDINGLAAVAAAVGTAIAVGEEWRTVHDMKLRTDRCRIGIVQPEMGHTGITEFMRIGQLAHAHHLDIMPHATIGAGIFLAASLHASAALPNIACHEFQHSIFEPNRRLVKGAMDCREGAYYLPEAHGLGVVPSDEAIALMKHYE